MSTVRLCNLSQSEEEALTSLSLPRLPISFGADSETLRLSEARASASSDTPCRTSDPETASKIAELLSSTDINYLNLRDKDGNAAVSLQINSSDFVSTILHLAPKALSCTELGSHKQQGHSISLSDKEAGNVDHDIIKQSNAIISGLVTPTSTKDAEEHASAQKAVKGRRPAKKTGVAGEIFVGGTDLIHDYGAGNLRKLVRGFLDSHRKENEEAVRKRFKIVFEELVAASSKKSLNLLSTECILDLLKYLHHQILSASTKRDAADEDDPSLYPLMAMHGLDMVHMSLILLTHRSMPKEIYKEEVIECLIDFIRKQISEILSAQHGSSYPTTDNDLRNGNGNGNGVTNIPKEFLGKMRKSTKFKINKLASMNSGILFKLCSIFPLLKDLLAIERLQDSILLALITSTIAVFGAENIQILQLKSISVACVVFNLYPEHRVFILDEVIQLLRKMHLSKRSGRAYCLPDCEQKQILVATALVLQLIQASVTLPDSIEDSLSLSSNCFKPAIEFCLYFWSSILHSSGGTGCHDFSEIKMTVENLVLDLITTVDLPEYPAACLMLQVLCLLLFGENGHKSKDAGVRGMTIDMLGMIASKLKTDSLLYQSCSHCIVQEINESPNCTEIRQELCVVCDEGKQSKAMLVCEEGKQSKAMLVCDCCRRWFHYDCVGSSSDECSSRGWLCCFCQCRRQLSLLASQLSQEKQINCGAVSISGVNILQQILVNYLHYISEKDCSATYVCQFYLCQWFKDDGYPLDLLPFYQGRVSSRTCVKDCGTVSGFLPRDIIINIYAALLQQRSLARGFDKILERLLAGLREQLSTLRAKALRAVSGVIEVDPGLLRDERVKNIVVERFHDAAISVREAAIELVGRHIVSQPDIAGEYIEKIAEHINDKGVSVRKRVIKIFRELCLSNLDAGRITETCCHIITRIHDEESSIQDLVCKTFYDLWFEGPSDLCSQFTSDGSMVPLDVAEKTKQIVAVLSMLKNHQPLVTIVKRTLDLDFCSHKTSGMNVVSQEAIRKRCELMSRYLLESILKVEESNNSESDIPTLPFVLALHAFCSVDATLCAPSSQPSRFVITLQPYLRTQSDSRATSQFLQSIVFIITAVLPLLRRPPVNFVEDLERDLRQLLFGCPFLSVVDACIKCLCTLCRVCGKGKSTIEFAVQNILKHLDSSCIGDTKRPHQTAVLRSLFSLGLFVRYGSELVENLSRNNIKIEQLKSVCMEHYESQDIMVKTRSLQALGFMCIAKPEFMIDANVKRIVEDSLSDDIDTCIKVQILRNFYDYLVDVEEHFQLEDLQNGGKQNGTVSVVNGEGDNSINVGIIQSYWMKILEKCLDINDAVRQFALKIMDIVLRQGLVHPVTLVPYLIAAEADEFEINSKLAHNLVMQMNEKHPSLFESRVGDGIMLTFKFILSCDSQLLDTKVYEGMSNRGSKVASRAKDAISRIYKLFQKTRSSKNKFLSSIIHKFDTGSLEKLSGDFLVYLTELLACLPFTSPDEPLFLLQIISRIVQTRAGNLEASMKKKIEKIKKCRRKSDDDNIVCADNVLLRRSESKEVKTMTAIAMETLKRDCHASFACSLLLQLKRYIKSVYGLSDARCQAFSTADSAKPGEVLVRQNIPFSTSDISTIDTFTSEDDILRQYQNFKKLLEEDSLDYIYSPGVNRKRPRLTTASPDVSRVQKTDLVAGSAKKRLFTPPKQTDHTLNQNERDQIVFKTEFSPCSTPCHRRKSSSRRKQ